MCKDCAQHRKTTGIVSPASKIIELLLEEAEVNGAQGVINLLRHDNTPVGEMARQAVREVAANQGIPVAKK